MCCIKVGVIARGIVWIYRPRYKSTLQFTLCTTPLKYENDCSIDATGIPVNFDTALLLRSGRKIDRLVHCIPITAPNDYSDPISRLRWLLLLSVHHYGIDYYYHHHPLVTEGGNSNLSPL